MITLTRARAAKTKLISKLDTGIDAAVGLTHTKGSYSIVVNLKDKAHIKKIPSSIDGVRIKTKIVGAITPRR